MIQSRSDLSNKKIFYVLTKALASTWKEKSHAYINDASCIPGVFNKFCTDKKHGWIETCFRGHDKREKLNHKQDITQCYIMYHTI